MAEGTTAEGMAEARKRPDAVDTRVIGTWGVGSVAGVGVAEGATGGHKDSAADILGTDGA